VYIIATNRRNLQHLRGWKIRQSREQLEGDSKCCWFLVLLGLYLNPEDECNMFSQNIWTFNELHGITSQKVLVFIATNMRISNPT
jgi:hypothetical protein